MTKPRELGIFDVKTHLSELLNQVEAGALIYITRRGRRIAELRPVAREKRPLTRGCAQNPGYRMAGDFNDTPEDLDEYE